MLKAEVGGMGCLRIRVLPADYLFPGSLLAVPFALTVQCKREEEVGAKPLPHPYPYPSPDIYVKLITALFFEIKALKRHLASHWFFF